jgi:hypothetical protein
MAAATRKAVTSFFACEKFIVVGASPNREKFGNKVFRALVGRFGAEKVIPGEWGLVRLSKMLCWRFTSPLSPLIKQTMQ